MDSIIWRNDCGEEDESRRRGSDTEMGRGSIGLLCDAHTISEPALGDEV